MFAVVRIRGNVEVRREVRDTLKMMKLESPNNCIVCPEAPEWRGMIEKVKDWVTYGEIDGKMLVALLKKRLRAGEKKVDEKMLKDIAGYENFEKFADDLFVGKIKLKQFKKLKQFFRLTPPSKGFKSVKLHYPKGDLGYRGKEINELLKRMI